MKAIYYTSMLLIAVLNPLVLNAKTKKIFELRTYTTYEGRLEALHQRFSNHTTKLFKKHGITNVAYWTPVDPERSKNTLIYIVSHQSLAASKTNWKTFVDDPAWKKIYADSRKDGQIVKNIESVFMTATEYSMIK